MVTAELELESRETQILRCAASGARIVSHDFNMGDWAPSRTEEVPHLEGGGKSRVYLWVVAEPSASAE
jgi:hypothetical protein